MLAAPHTPLAPNAIQYHLIGHSTIPYHPKPFNTIQYHQISSNTFQYHQKTISCHPIPSNTFQNHPILSNNIQCHKVSSNNTCLTSFSSMVRALVCQPSGPGSIPGDLVQSLLLQRGTHRLGKSSPYNIVIEHTYLKPSNTTKYHHLPQTF